jgi:phage terminase large subunit
LNPSPNAQFPAKLKFLFEPHRYKVAYGGRGSGKSWGIARALLILAAQRTLRILCTRETQRSIRESVHHTLDEQIHLLGLTDFYDVKASEIVGINGSGFVFEGIRQNIANIKSFEGFDIVWVEEAQTVSKHSWDVLIPTIRKDHSEVWVGFNPDLETDETYQRFVVNADKLPKLAGTKKVDAVVAKINYMDNPWFPDTLRAEMQATRENSEDDYLHIYEGFCKQVVEGAIYRNELLAADKEQRICRVPYDATKPVHTFWDLGFGDNTSIWFAQSIGFEFRLIDYLSASLQGLQYYLKALQEKPYVYGTDHLPHDARAHELGSGRSIEEQIRATGRTVKIVRKLSIEDGIAAARAIFGRCWFDSEKCADGLQALRHYRYVMDDKLASFKKEPLHDWASHPADAFRYFAVAIREPEIQREEERLPVSFYGDQGWMA